MFRALRAKADLLLSSNVSAEAWEAANHNLHDAMDTALQLRGIRW